MLIIEIKLDVYNSFSHLLTWCPCHWTTDRLWGTLCGRPVQVSQQPVHLTEVAVWWTGGLQDGRRREKLPGHRWESDPVSKMLQWVADDRHSECVTLTHHWWHLCPGRTNTQQVPWNLLPCVFSFVSFLSPPLAWWSSPGCSADHTGRVRDCTYPNRQFELKAEKACGDYHPLYPLQTNMTQQSY